MRYPQAFLFVDTGVELPTEQNIAAWSEAKSFYVPDVSPRNRALDRRIRLMMRLHYYLEPVGTPRRQVLVLEGCKVGYFLSLALGAELRRVMWIDSAEHCRRLRMLNYAAMKEWEFSRFLNASMRRYNWARVFIRDETDYGLVEDEIFERIIRALSFQDDFGGRSAGISTVFVALRRHITAQTRTGIVNRIDLEGEVRQAA